MFCSRSTCGGIRFWILVFGAYIPPWCLFSFRSSASLQHRGTLHSSRSTASFPPTYHANYAHLAHAAHVPSVFISPLDFSVRLLRLSPSAQMLGQTGWT